MYKYKPKNYEPKVGDIVCYVGNLEGLHNHVSIITGFRHDGGQVYTTDNKQCISFGINNLRVIETEVPTNDNISIGDEVICVDDSAHCLYNKIGEIRTIRGINKSMDYFDTAKPKFANIMRSQREGFRVLLKATQSHSKETNMNDDSMDSIAYGFNYGYDYSPGLEDSKSATVCLSQAEPTQPQGNNMAQNIEIKVNGKNLDLGTKTKKPKSAFASRKKYTAQFFCRTSGELVETLSFKSVKAANEALESSCAPHQLTMVLSQEISVTKTKANLDVVKS